MNAARNALLGLTLAVCAANAAAPAFAEDSVAPRTAAEETVDLPQPGPGPIDKYDPLEPMNRLTYRFNANFDKWVFLPALNGYRFVTPKFLRSAFSNFLTNVNSITTLWNSALQGSAKKTFTTFGRIVVNTTIGFGGLLDPATPLGIAAYKEDFGQTLGKWGVHPGAYLVIPILGPSSARDAGGMLVDRALLSYLQWLAIGSFSSDYPFIYALEALQYRDDVAFRYGQLGSPFEYDLIRWFYFEYRQLAIDI